MMLRAWVMMSIGVLLAARPASSEEAKGKPVTRKPEAAVKAALDWLVRHQDSDGGWRAAGFAKMCKDACKNRAPKMHGEGRGEPEHDAGITGLAMLALAGHLAPGKGGGSEVYQKSLEKSAAYLASLQISSENSEENGRYGGGGEDQSEQRIYNHAIATLALCEAITVSKEFEAARGRVTDAVRLCVGAQNPGKAWRYGVRPGENDTSVTGWMLQVLASAKKAKLDIPKKDIDAAYKGASAWLKQVTAPNGKTGYFAPGDEGSRLSKPQWQEFFPFSKEMSPMTAVGVMGRIICGEKPKDLARSTKLLMEQLPRWREREGRNLSTINMYYWYYGTKALQATGGKDFKSWAKALQEALLPNQRQGGDEDGSWDTADEWSLIGGRVYSTAICAIALETSLKAK